MFAIGFRSTFSECCLWDVSASAASRQHRGVGPTTTRLKLGTDVERRAGISGSFSILSGYAIVLVNTELTFYLEKGFSS